MVCSFNLFNGEKQLNVRHLYNYLYVAFNTDLKIIDFVKMPNKWV